MTRRDMTPRAPSRFLAVFAVLFALAGLTRAGADEMAALPPVPDNAEIAVFAGGCFWCVEKDFDHVAGVLETTSGYIGGETDNPTYKKVTYGNTGHYEAVRIVYDPAIVTYDQLLDTFWRTVDPTDAGGQFCDRGESYRTGIFAQNEAQLDAAKASKAALENANILNAPIVTEVTLNEDFYPGEVYHQDYYKKSPARYKVYRWSCGRDQRVQDLWGSEAHQGVEHS